MRDRDLLSISEKVLLAAYDLEETGRHPFSAEDLVIAAWKMFPDAFGLAGYRNEKGHLKYPDSNRIYAEIMGSKPIRKRGLLVKVGRKMYQLTEAGRIHARLLLSRLDTSSIEKAGLAREVVKELKRLLTSKAIVKYKNGQLANLTFHDACTFWGISPRSSAIEFNGRIANFHRIIDTAQETFNEKEVTFEHAGEAYSSHDLKILLEVHNELERRFQEEIEIIKRRTDERV